jgi:hypothetical protein
MLSNNNRSKKQQSYIDYYENLWANTAGNDFEKSFALFSDYCGYHLTGLDYCTATVGNHYTNTIRAVIDEYRQNYLVNFRDTLACSTGYLLAAVGSRIKNSKTPLGTEGRMAAIVEVIKNHTQLDIENFKTCDWYKPMTFVSNSHGKEWINLLVEQANTIDEILLALDSKIFNSFELISYLLSWSPGLRSRGYSAQKILRDVDDRVSLSEDEIKNLFSLSLKNKKYEIAKYLFSRFYSLPLKNACYIPALCFDIDADILRYNEMRKFGDMLEIIIHSISKSIKGDLILELIDHMLVYGREWIEYNHNSIDGTPTFCMGLFQKNKHIKDWDVVERKIREYFKPDYNLAFYFSIKMLYPSGIEELLREYKLDTTTACWYAKPCFFEIPDTYQTSKNKPVNVYHPSLIEDSENNLVKITPLMALIHKAETIFNNVDLGREKIDWLRAIKALVSYNPFCVLTKDSEGRNVFDYLQALEQFVISVLSNIREEEEGEEEEMYDAFGVYELLQIEKAIEEVNKARNKCYTNNMVTFFLATNNNRKVSPEGDVPKDIYREVLQKMYQS